MRSLDPRYYLKVWEQWGTNRHFVLAFLDVAEYWQMSRLDVWWLDWLGTYCERNFAYLNYADGTWCDGG